jgi:AAA+ superfamily predicted ATPase
MEASRGVEQMLNAMQNILLQRLEDFEGIFIATTNLVKHLDLAFDRRFLYKVEFQKPNNLVRSQILKKAFEQLNEVEIVAIANKHELTGGQIMNIRKKLLVKQLLLNIAVTKTTIEQLCIEELSLRANEHTRAIGFKAA